MCSWALLWRIGPFLLTNASCRCCSFQCISSICWAYFSDVMILPGFGKIRPPAHHQTVTMTISGASLALASALKLLLGPTIELVVSGSRINNPPPWHVTTWLRNGSLLCTVRKDSTSKQRFFFHLKSAHEASLIELFHLSNLFQIPREL